VRSDGSEVILCSFQNPNIALDAIARYPYVYRLDVGPYFLTTAIPADYITNPIFGDHPLIACQYDVMHLWLTCQPNEQVGLSTRAEVIDGDAFTSARSSLFKPGVNKSNAVIGGASYYSRITLGTYGRGMVVQVGSAYKNSGFAAQLTQQLYAIDKIAFTVAVIEPMKG
jgi:hypothetical protein